MEGSRSACIQLKPVAESDEPLPEICFFAGSLPDTMKNSQLKNVEISIGMFDKFLTIIQRDLSPGPANNGVTPFFSVTIIENSTSTLYIIDTRETLLSLINQFKRTADQDASIAGTGRVDQVLQLLQ